MGGAGGQQPLTFLFLSTRSSGFPRECLSITFNERRSDNCTRPLSCQSQTCIDFPLGARQHTSTLTKDRPAPLRFSFSQSVAGGLSSSDMFPQHPRSLRSQIVKYRTAFIFYRSLPPQRSRCQHASGPNLPCSPPRQKRGTAIQKH